MPISSREWVARLYIEAGVSTPRSICHFPTPAHNLLVAVAQQLDRLRRALCRAGAAALAARRVNPRRAAQAAHARQVGANLRDAERAGADAGEVPARVGYANAGISRLTLPMLMFNIGLFF